MKLFDQHYPRSWIRSCLSSSTTEITGLDKNTERLDTIPLMGQRLSNLAAAEFIRRCLSGTRGLWR